jgi:hypothetical protein
VGRPARDEDPLFFAGGIAGLGRTDCAADFIDRGVISHLVDKVGGLHFPEPGGVIPERVVCRAKTRHKCDLRFRRPYVIIT